MAEYSGYVELDEKGGTTSQELSQKSFTQILFQDVLTNKVVWAVTLTSMLSLIHIYQPQWRMDGDNRYLTDEKNYIIDLKMGKIDDPKTLAEDLIHTSLLYTSERSLFSY